MTVTEPASGGVLARRAGWMLADQMANSLFSLMAGLVAAQLLGVHDFGVFATLFAAYLVVRDSLRALVFDPLIIRHAAVASSDQTAVVVGLGAVGALAATGVAMVLSLVWSGLGTGTALAFGVATLTLVVVEGLRALEVLDARPDRAARLSAAVLVGSAAAALGLLVGSPGTAVIFGVLAVGGAVAGASEWRRLALVWRPGVLWGWVRDHRSIGVPLFVDYVASAGLTSLAIFVLAGVDLGEAAGLRGAQMVAAPVTLLHVALVQALTAEGARVRGSKPQAIERFGVYALAAMVLSGLGFLAVVATFDSTVIGLLGDSGSVAQPVLVPMIAFTVAAAPALAASGVLRSRDRAKVALQARLWSSVPFAVGLAAGAYVDGARGVAIGGTLAQLATTGLWWRAVVTTRPPAG